MKLLSALGVSIVLTVAAAGQQATLDSIVAIKRRAVAPAPQQQVAEGPCVLDLLCKAPSGNTVNIHGFLVVDNAIIAPTVTTTGDLRAGSANGDTRLWISNSGHGVQVVGSLTIRPEGGTFVAEPVLAPGGAVMAFGTGAVPAGGAATVVFPAQFSRFANTDPSSGGDYVIVVGAMSAEGVYWDQAASTPDHFVVRSVTGKQAPFSYYIGSARKSLTH